MPVGERRPPTNGRWQSLRSRQVVMASGTLSGSLAIVTGGGSGIGRAVCGTFSKQGAILVVADINQQAAKDTVKQLSGPGHCAMSVDVSDRQSVSSLFNTIKAHYNRVPDIIVNCAGIFRAASFLEAKDSHSDDQINVNLKGTFMITQEGCRHMIESKLKAGSIVNISSMAAHKATPNASLYSASKAGVEAFTKVVALEMAQYGIRANVVSPGIVDTPMMRGYFGENPVPLAALAQTVPLGKVAQPVEIAEACAFLASPMSSYMTGSIVHVNGGIL